MRSVPGEGAATGERRVTGNGIPVEPRHVVDHVRGVPGPAVPVHKRRYLWVFVFAYLGPCCSSSPTAYNTNGPEGKQFQQCGPSVPPYMLLQRQIALLAGLELGDHIQANKHCSFRQLMVLSQHAQLADRPP